MRSSRALFLALLLVSAPARAAAAEAVPEAAREAFERGVIAAEGQQWLAALRYFGEAQKAAPASPAVMFNLGLAYGKAGRELIGIAWLRAYLAAQPQAPNGNAVGKEILRLEIATEEKIARVIQEALAAASAGKYPHLTTPKVWHQQAATGDIDGAVKGGLRATDAWYAHAMALGEAGLVAKVEDALRQVTDAKQRSLVYHALVSHFVPGDCLPTLARKLPQAEADAARDAAARIQDPEIKRAALARLLCRDLRPQDLAQAEKVLADMRKDPKRSTKSEWIYGGTRLYSYGGDFSSPGDFGALLQALLLRYATTGDFANAARLVDWALANAGAGPDWALSIVVAAQLRHGDVEGAKATARKVAAVAPGPMKALAEVVLGNYEPARGLVAGTKCDAGSDWGVAAFRDRRERIVWIILNQVVSGDLAGARATARAAAAQCAAETGLPADKVRLYDNEKSYASDIARARLAKGDVAGARESLKESGYAFGPDDVWPTLDLLLQRARDAAEIAVIEQAVPQMLPVYAWARVRALMEVADAYTKRQADADARRALAEAARQLIEEEEKLVSSTWGSLPGFEDVDVARLMRAAAAVGDQTTARTLQTLLDRRPNTLVARWATVATELSSDDVAADLPKALREAAASSAVAEDLGEVAHKLAGWLFYLRALATRR
jgi:tetratricopeptide (TPR) repeat protein